MVVQPTNRFLECCPWKS